MIRENYLPLFEFMYDRHLVWYNRFVLKTEKPWTQDNILSKYLFCNIYRYLDKGTSYIKETIIDNPQVLPENKLLNIIYYRYFNSYGFFNYVDPLDYRDFNFKATENLLDNAVKVNSLYNNAYLVTQVAFDKNYRKGDKHIQILKRLEWVVDQLRNYNYFFRISYEGHSADRVIDLLRLLYGCGDFLSYEIFCDLTYSSSLIIHTENSFVNIGPGASKLFKIIEKEELPYKNLLSLTYEMRDNQDLYFKELADRTGKDFKKIRVSDKSLLIKYRQPLDESLTLRSIEHSCCEYRKYLKLKSGEGKRRYFSTT